MARLVSVASWSPTARQHRVQAEEPQGRASLGPAIRNATALPCCTLLRPFRCGALRAAACAAPPRLIRGPALTVGNRKGDRLCGVHIELIGFVAKAPEFRNLPNGDRHAILLIEKREGWRDCTTGERKTRSTWHDVRIQSRRL